MRSEPSPIMLEAAERSEQQGITDQPGIVTRQDAWHRVHSGLGWIAAGLVVGFVVLCLQSIPVLLRLFDIELVPIAGEELSFFRLFSRTVGLIILCFSLCLLAGLMRCLLYPGTGPGVILALVAFGLFSLWAIGWIVSGSLGILDPTTSSEDARQRAAFLNLLGLVQQAVFVMFLREIGRDCSDPTVLSRVRWMLGLAAGFVCLVFLLFVWLSDPAADGDLREIVVLVGLLVLLVPMSRLVRSAREAVGRQVRPSATLSSEIPCTRDTH